MSFGPAVFIVLMLMWWHGCAEERVVGIPRILWALLIDVMEWMLVPDRRLGYALLTLGCIVPAHSGREVERY